MVGKWISQGHENISAIRIAMVSLLVILLAIIAVFIFRSRQVQLVWTTIDVLRVLSDFHNQLQDRESAQRGYLLTGDPDYLMSPIRGPGPRATLDTLKGLLADKPHELKLVLLLDKLLEAKLAELDTTLALRNEGKLKEALTIVNADTGELYMDQIEGIVADIRRSEESNLERRTGVRDTSLIWVYVMLGLAILVLTYSLWTLNRQLARNLDSLAKERARFRDIALKRKVEIDRRERAERYSEVLIQNLEQRNRALDRYAYTTSHDLLQPLRTIAGTIEALQEDFPQLISGDAGTYFEMISSSTVRMQSMVTQLLERSRQATGEESIPLDLRAIATEVATDLSQLIHEHRAVLHVEELPFVLAPPIAVRTILQNLIANAVKYGAEGRDPVVVVRAVPLKEAQRESLPSMGPDVGEQERVTTSRWRVSVIDNGRGIAPDKIRQVLDFGNRGDANDGDGHGIGLATCDEMARAMGTQLSVESTLGMGATFAFEVVGVELEAGEPGGRAPLDASGMRR